MIELRTENRLSFSEIGKIVGLTGERVRQLLGREGVTITREPKKPHVSIKREGKKVDRIRAIYGCSVAQFDAIQGDLSVSEPASPAFVYRMQRARHKREAGWRLSFPDWWMLWCHQWEKRLPQQLVMVPIDDELPVSMENVVIQTRSEVMTRFWQGR